MQDIERASIAEQNREIISLLKDMKKQGEVVRTAAELKSTLTPDEFKTARMIRIGMASLGDCIETEAKARGFTSVDAYVKDGLSAKRKSVNTDSVYDRVARIDKHED